MKEGFLLSVANWLIMGYFVVLFAERLQSIIRSVNDKNTKLFGSGFHKYVYLTTILSLTGFIVLLLVGNGAYLKTLGTTEYVYHADVNYILLAVTIGVILLSGMVHTEFTIPPVQFAAYGLLIGAIAIYTVVWQKHTGNRGSLWVSFAYLVALSMAIPVVYPTKIAKAKIFYILESVVSVILVAVFAILTELVFSGRGENLFYIAPIAIALIGDIPVLFMRKKEEMNWFVLIFLGLSLILWIVGRVLF